MKSKEARRSESRIEAELRKLNETLERRVEERTKQLKESESRFRIMSDNAPVLIWMSGLDKGCDYFNRGWLNFTGRTLEQELGNGWAEGVHPSDFERCLDIYVSSFDARREFRMEYRLRRHDGKYRWIHDIGVPRYDGAGTFVGYIGSCIDVTDRKLAEEALCRLPARIMQAQEQERSRVARELHDGIGQLLASARFRLRGVQETIETNQAMGKQLRSVLTILEQAGDLARATAHQLHPTELAGLGLARTIRKLAGEFQIRAQVNVAISVSPTLNRLPDELQLQLFRIVQEGLTNVERHARASHVILRLHRQKNKVRLELSDDGVGQTRKKTNGGLGLASMEQRAALIGGTFNLQLAKGKGTRIIVEAPIP